MTTETRGIRNNNPANIRRGQQWRGLAPRKYDKFGKPCVSVCRKSIWYDEQWDKSFCQFVAVTWGVRALIRILRTYVTIHNLVTISQIIRRFAPPTENATDKYVAYVVKSLEDVGGFEYQFSDSDFNPKDPSIALYYLCESICRIESNYILSYEVFISSLNLI